MQAVTAFGQGSGYDNKPPDKEGAGDDVHDHQQHAVPGSYSDASSTTNHFGS